VDRAEEIVDIGEATVPLMKRCCNIVYTVSSRVRVSTHRKAAVGSVLSCLVLSCHCFFLCIVLALSVKGSVRIFFALSWL
jgi:hypothetical protein